jgi:hypothetical protein
LIIRSYKTNHLTSSLLPAGDKIGGRYLVHQALMGGMGEVYLKSKM